MLQIKNDSFPPPPSLERNYKQIVKFMAFHPLHFVNTDASLTKNE